MDSIRRAISRRSSLWSNSDFRAFWVGETIANFGGQLGLIALPLIAAISLHASPFQMGLLGAMGSLPRMIVGVFAGTWVDRRKRRPIIIIVNILRMLTFAVIPVAAALDALTYELLLVLAVITGMLGIIFDSAWSAMVPTLVPRNDLADANGKLWASMSLAQITGPAIAGTLIAWMSGPYVMTVTALTFGISAFFVTRIATPEPEPDAPMHGGVGQVLGDVREGFSELIRSAVVRPLTTSLVSIMFGASIFSAVYVLYLTKEMKLSSDMVGVVFAIGGSGALIGSMVAAPLAKRYGYGQVILWGAVVHGAANFLIPMSWLAGSFQIAVVAAGEVLAWTAFQSYDINRFSLRQSVTRPNLMGRVASSTMTISAGAGMAGSFIGGSIGEVFGIRTALLVGAAIMAVAAWFVWRSPIPAMAHLGREHETPIAPELTETERALVADAEP